MESLAAILAWVRPGVGVDEEVGGKGGAALERLPALLARERSLAVVNGPEKVAS